MSAAFESLEFPAWATWGQRRGIILPQPAGRGENGRRRCRWCASEVPKGRISWCSDACSRRFLRVFSWQTLARYIGERDGWTCQRCGTTAPGWRRGTERSAWCESTRRSVRASALIPAWEVDHIVPVRMGGTDNPTNLRLLCRECHVAVGYWQRADERDALAKARMASESVKLKCGQTQTGAIRPPERNNYVA